MAILDTGRSPTYPGIHTVVDVPDETGVRVTVKLLFICPYCFPAR